MAYYKRRYAVTRGRAGYKPRSRQQRSIYGRGRSNASRFRRGGYRRSYAPRVLRGLPYKVDHRVHRAVGTYSIPLSYVLTNSTAVLDVPTQINVSLQQFFTDTEWTTQRNMHDEYRINMLVMTFHPCQNSFNDSFVPGQKSYTAIQSNHIVGAMVTDNTSISGWYTTDMLKDIRTRITSGGKQFSLKFRPRYRTTIYDLRDGGKSATLNVSGPERGVSGWVVAPTARTDIPAVCNIYMGGLAGGNMDTSYATTKLMAEYIMEIKAYVSWRRQE